MDKIKSIYFVKNTNKWFIKLLFIYAYPKIILKLKFKTGYHNYIFF